MPRDRPGAVHHEPSVIAARALQMARSGRSRRCACTATPGGGAQRDRGPLDARGRGAHPTELRMRFLPVGADALLVEVDDTAAATALYDEALRRHVAAVDVVPAARTVLFAGVHDVAALEREVAGWSVTPACRRPTYGRGAHGVRRPGPRGGRAAVGHVHARGGHHPRPARWSSPSVASPASPTAPGCPRSAPRPGWRARAPASRPVPWAWPARSPASTRPPRPAAGSSSGTPTSCCGTTPGRARDADPGTPVRFVEVSR